MEPAQRQFRRAEMKEMVRRAAGERENLGRSRSAIPAATSPNNECEGERRCVDPLGEEGWVKESLSIEGAGLGERLREWDILLRR